MTTPVTTDADTTTLVGAVRRHRGLFLVAFVVVAFGTLAYRSLLRPPSVAEARVVVEDPRTNASGIGGADPVAYFATQLALARLPVLAREAVAAAPGSATLSVSNLRVTSDQGSDTIIFTATLPRGRDAAARALANGLVAQYAQQSEAARRQEARASLSTVDASLLALQSGPYSLSPGSISLREQLKSQQSALTEAAAAGLSVLAVSPAVTQPSAVPGVSRLGLTLVLGGSLLAIAVVLGADGEGRRLSQDDEAAVVTGLPILAHLPLSPLRRDAADAVWSAVTPPGGRVFVLVAGHGLDTSVTGLARLRHRRPTRLALPGGGSESVVVLDPPVQSVHYVDLGSDAGPIVIVVGPRTRASGLREAVAELGRARLSATGLIWVAPGRALTPARARRRRRPAPSLQRPDALARHP